MDSTCGYDMLYNCLLPKLDGYRYCKEHILEDRSSPYRLCSYIYTHGSRRCANPAMKKEGIGLCEEHTRQAQLGRQAFGKRHKPPATSESLLVSLAHYAKIERKTPNTSLEVSSNTESSMLEHHMEEMLNVETVDDGEGMRAIDPFVDIDGARVNSAVSRVMDFASESESDPEPLVIHNTGYVSDSGSEIEEMDEKDDVLKHARIYSAEEVLVITKEKLIRLQSLYIEQFRRLQHSLREKRRTYLHTLKKEKETLSSIYNQSRDSAKEQKLYNKLRSLNRYHKRNGVEAVMHKKALDRRAQATEGIVVRPPPTVKCIFTEGGVKCGEKTLPVSKYCQKHIMIDTNQVLFRTCACSEGGNVCAEPVLNVFENAYCIYHTNIATIKQYKLEKANKQDATATVVKPAYPSVSFAEDELSLNETSGRLELVRAKDDDKCDIEAKLCEMFGDSENTDTASEKDTLNVSQNLEEIS